MKYTFKIIEGPYRLRCERCGRFASDVKPEPGSTAYYPILLCMKCYDKAVKEESDE